MDIRLDQTTLETCPFGELRHGAAAYAAGLELHQLASQGTDLEDVFFHLVETAQQQHQQQDQQQEVVA